MPSSAYVGSKLTNDSTIIGPGVPAVTVNGLPSSKLGDSVSDGHTMVEGSATVLVSGQPMIRLGDKDSDGHSVSTNVSPDVFINGA